MHKIKKLAEEKWNITRYKSNGVIAWNNVDDLTNRSLSTAKIITESEYKVCTNTSTVFFELDDVNWDDAKTFLTKSKMLPKNYNELEVIGRYINV